jgi:hypothetical protein
LVVDEATRQIEHSASQQVSQHSKKVVGTGPKADHPVWWHELWDFDELFEGGEDWWLDISDDEESVGGISYAQEIKDCNNQEVLRVRETFQQWMTAGKPDTAESNTGFPITLTY